MNISFSYVTSVSYSNYNSNSKIHDLNPALNLAFKFSKPQFEKPTLYIYKAFNGKQYKIIHADNFTKS